MRLRADTAYCNARIYTFDPVVPRAEGLAVRDGRIIAIGSSADVRELASDRGVVDLKGRTVLPGFVDCHVHLLWYGLSFSRVDLTGVESLEAAIRRVETAVEQTAEGQWVLGRGWDQSLWAGESLPSREDLDLIAPGHPVALERKCGHIVWVNSAALSIAGIRQDTPDPQGGRIDRRGAAGEPTGILRENAVKLVPAYTERPTLEQALPALQTAIRMAHREGVVGVHAMEARESFQACQVLRSRGELDLRVLMQIPEESLDAAREAGLRGGLGDDWLRVGGIKMFADGSLGARTAALVDPYESEPENRGILVADTERISAVAARAAEAGFPLFVHAIGDRANRMALDAFEALKRSGSPPLRHRIEHAQILRREDVGRLARLGLVASMQPIHAVADMMIADRYLGQRADRAYVFKELASAGAHLAFGSDAPVEDLSPLRGIHAAVTRRRRDGYPGSVGWHPEQKITVAQAIAAYTVGAAYASGDEGTRGAITPGKLADFVVLSHDLIASPPESIPDCRVMATVIGGRVVYAVDGAV